MKSTTLKFITIIFLLAVSTMAMAQVKKSTSLVYGR